MITAIFTTSNTIATRHIELIAESNCKAICLHAHSHIESLDILKQYNLDVVLVDLKIACINNYELLKQIKKYNKNTMVIILYSLKYEQSLQKCKSLGADYILDEYVDFEKIPGIINDMMLTKNI